MVSQKKRKSRFLVIPAEAGIQEFQKVINRLDTRFRGYDDYLRMHQCLGAENTVRAPCRIFYRRVNFLLKFFLNGSISLVNAEETVKKGW